MSEVGMASADVNAQPRAGSTESTTQLLLKQGPVFFLAVMILYGLWSGGPDLVEKAGAVLRERDLHHEQQLDKVLAAQERGIEKVVAAFEVQQRETRTVFEDQQRETRMDMRQTADLCRQALQLAPVQKTAH